MTAKPKNRQSSSTLLARVEVKSAAELRAWLRANHSQSESIWLVTWKRKSPHYVPYSAIVEEALCFGWIDSLPRALDEERTMIRLSPRNPKSAWSQVNRDRVQQLIQAGRMTKAGMKAVALAKGNGGWERLQMIDGNQLPPDLESALNANSRAQGFFHAFPPSIKRGILEWIEQARTPATRDARISKAVALAAENIRANQYRPKKAD